MSLKQFLNKPVEQKRYYLPEEISQHNTANDCYVSFFNKVYDLTRYIQENKENETIDLLIKYAGQDITFWFDDHTKDLKTYIDVQNNQQKYVILQRENINQDRIDRWWNQDDKYLIGHLTQKVRKIKIINTLTKHENIIKVGSEESINEILNRYLPINCHAKSYTWKRLTKPLNMEQTLTENGIEDETQEYENLDIPIDQQYIPALHLYFNDDLSIM